MQARNHPRTTATRVRNRFTTCLMVGLLSVALTAPAFAQASKQLVTPEGPSWWAQNLGEQLAALLDSPVEASKQQGLQHCLHFGSLYSHEIDLSAAVPKLLEIYDKDPVEGYRIMALSALHEIGDPESMFVLLERVNQETSPRVRRLTLATLVSYAQDHRYFRESLYVRNTMAQLVAGP